MLVGNCVGSNDLVCVFANPVDPKSENALFQFARIYLEPTFFFIRKIHLNVVITFSHVP